MFSGPCRPPTGSKFRNVQVLWTFLMCVNLQHFVTERDMLCTRSWNSVFPEYTECITCLVQSQRTPDTDGGCRFQGILKKRARKRLEQARHLARDYETSNAPWTACRLLIARCRRPACHPSRPRKTVVRGVSYIKKDAVLAGPKTSSKTLCARALSSGAPPILCSRPSPPSPLRMLASDNYAWVGV